MSSETIDSNRNVTPSTMYQTDSIWNHSRQLSISRTETAFCSALEGLLRLSIDKIVIVDAYGYTQKAIEAVVSFIKLLKINRVNDQLPDIFLFYKESDNSACTENVKANIVSSLGNALSGVSLAVASLSEVQGEDTFHNRCILTELGGVSSGHGIGFSGDEAHTDELVLMESHIYEKKWLQFVEDRCFDVVDQS